MSRLHKFLLCVALSAGTFAAERAELPQHNFLFIVDSSMSMAPRKATAIKLVRDIITAGFNGQIETGDSIDIWTYDTENNLYGFPPQIWRANEAQRIAGTAAQYLEQYKFKGRSRFANVATDLSALVPQTKNLLTIIITDGEEPFSGISLDLIINEYLAKKNKLGDPSAEPLLISLAAIKGSFRTWTAYFGEDELHLASLPERRMAPLAVVAAETKMPEEKASAPDARKQPARKRGEPSATVARVLPLSSEDSEETALEKPLELSLSEQLKTLKWPPQSRTAAPVSNPVPAAKRASTAPAVNLAAPAQKAVVAEAPKELKKAANVALLPTAAVSTNKATNSPVVVASSGRTPPPATGPKNISPAPAKMGKFAANASAGSSATNLVTATTLHRGFYISGMAGLSCLLLGIYVIRKLRRPTQSIISRSLLQR